ncbi:MAG: hypothetical protein RR557_07800 [Bacilli bacterium]
MSEETKFKTIEVCEKISESGHKYLIDRLMEIDPKVVAFCLNLYEQKYG